MTSMTSKDPVAIFKKVYGQINKNVPKNFILSREIPFQSSASGDEYVEAVVLSGEVGWTILGTDQNSTALNTAISSNVKQARIQPSQIVLRSLVPVGFMTRAAKGTEDSFIKGTSYVMESHTESHDRLLEIIRHNGQSSRLLGRVCYSSAIYRGNQLTAGATAGSGLLLSDGVTYVDFATGGVSAINAAGNYAILFEPGDFAPGFWVGNEGAQIVEVNASNVVVASGTLKGVDVGYGFIYVDFAPVVASSVGSHRICFKGMESAKEAVGLHKILTNTGSLFEINASDWSLWKTPQLNGGLKSLNLKAILTGVSLAVDAGGLDKSLMIMVPTSTFANLISNEAALRKYDASYKGKAQNGFETIEFFAQNGSNVIVADRFMMEGMAMGIVKEDFLRSGSSDVSFQPNGTGSREMIKLLDDFNAYDIRSYSDQFLFCRRPARQILWTNFNWESTTGFGS